MAETAEQIRLQEDKTRQKNWKRWGPYLSERQWGTVREDYSKDGNCWDYLTHDQARSRAYRWGEDGLLGITDRQARLCFCLALWNGKDSILKERLFGLTGTQGNHGEDVKECYYYLDSTPTHSYMKALYKYPQSEFPYASLEHENKIRGLLDPEFELEDTGIFEKNRYWDVFAEYAKNTPNDILCKITACNRGPETAVIHLLPTLWFRNTWIWGCTHEGCGMKPSIKEIGERKVICKHESLGSYYWEIDKCPDGSSPQLLYTENETNTRRLFSVNNYTPYVKDAFHRYIIQGEWEAVSPNCKGTKVSSHYVLKIAPGQEASIRCRLYAHDEIPPSAFDNFDEIMKIRKHEADQFYNTVIPMQLSPEEKNISRQAYAGLLWSKQFYHYIVKDWLTGDKEMPPPPEERKKGRNSDWLHLFNRDILSMPDKWEYPWYAAWDLAFHMIPFANVDLEFAKQQLLLMLREWYMHPNGQIPAFEFEYGDVNPPVHAWAALKVFKASGPEGQRDHQFLARCFQKLILNFTWWVNRKDPYGRNIFSGGFLGLDNIGVFDRSKPLPVDGELEQADGTAWMAFYCLTMLDIALELAFEDPTYEDMASKFFEHFIAITDAMNAKGLGMGLWDQEDGFFYDHLRKGNTSTPLKIRSLVGLVPLFSCLVLETNRLQKLSGFHKRTKWFVDNRQDLVFRISFMKVGNNQRMLLAIPTKEELMRVLKYMLDEEEFLSPYGIRSLSKVHQKIPFKFYAGSEEYSVEYVPGESNTYLFGGNSNWRGPIWFCMNYLIIQSLQRYYYFYGESLKVECPTRSGNWMQLNDVAEHISQRLGRIFLPDKKGYRPCHGTTEQYAKDPYWKDLVLYYEYFNGDSGRGCGASHQTGWTALIANCYNIGAKLSHGGMIRQSVDNPKIQVQNEVSVQKPISVQNHKSKLSQTINTETSFVSGKRESLSHKSNLFEQNKRVKYDKSFEVHLSPDIKEQPAINEFPEIQSDQIFTAEVVTRTESLEAEDKKVKEIIDRETVKLNNVDVKKRAALFEKVTLKSQGRQDDQNVQDSLVVKTEEGASSFSEIVDVKKVAAFFELGGQQKLIEKPHIKLKESDIEETGATTSSVEQIILSNPIIAEDSKVHSTNTEIPPDNRELHIIEKELIVNEPKIVPQDNMKSILRMNSNIPVPAKRRSLPPKMEMTESETFNDQISEGNFPEKKSATRVILGDVGCFVVDKINSPKRTESFFDDDVFFISDKSETMHDNSNPLFEKQPSRIPIMSPPNQAKVPIIRKDSNKNPFSPIKDTNPSDIAVEQTNESNKHKTQTRPLAAPRSSLSSDSEVTSPKSAPKRVSFADELTKEATMISPQVVRVTQSVIYPPGKFIDDKKIPEENNKLDKENKNINELNIVTPDVREAIKYKSDPVPSYPITFTEDNENIQKFGIDYTSPELLKKPPIGGICVLPLDAIKDALETRKKNEKLSQVHSLDQHKTGDAKLPLKVEESLRWNFFHSSEPAGGFEFYESTPSLNESIKSEYNVASAPSFIKRQDPISQLKSETKVVSTPPVIPIKELDTKSEIKYETKVVSTPPLIPTKELDTKSKIKSTTQLLSTSPAVSTKELDTISKTKSTTQLVSTPPVIPTKEFDTKSKMKSTTQFVSTPPVIPTKELDANFKIQYETNVISIPPVKPTKELHENPKSKVISMPSVTPTMELDTKPKINSSTHLVSTPPVVPTKELDTKTEIKYETKVVSTPPVIQTKEFDANSKVTPETKVVPIPSVISAKQLVKPEINYETKVISTSSTIPSKKLDAKCKVKSETESVISPIIPIKKLDTKLKMEQETKPSEELDKKYKVKCETLIPQVTPNKEENIKLNSNSSSLVNGNEASIPTKVNDSLKISKSLSSSQEAEIKSNTSEVPSEHKKTTKKSASEQKATKTPSKTKAQKISGTPETKAEKKPVIIKEERLIDPVTGKEKIIITMQEEINEDTSNLDGDSFKRNTTTSEKVYVRQEGSKEIKTTVTKERKETVAVVSSENTMTFRYDNGVWKTEDGEIVDSLPVPMEMITRTIETTRASSTKPTEQSTVTTSKTTVLPPSPSTPKTQPSKFDFDNSETFSESDSHSELNEPCSSTPPKTATSDSNAAYSSAKVATDLSKTQTSSQSTHEIKNIDSRQTEEIKKEKEISRLATADNHFLAKQNRKDRKIDTLETPFTHTPDNISSSSIPASSPSQNSVLRIIQVQDQSSAQTIKRQQSHSSPVVTVAAAPLTQTVTRIVQNQDQKNTIPITGPTALNQAINIVQVTTQSPSLTHNTITSSALSQSPVNSVRPPSRPQSLHLQPSSLSNISSVENKSTSSNQQPETVRTAHVQKKVGSGGSIQVNVNSKETAV